MSAQPLFAMPIQGTETDERFTPPGYSKHPDAACVDGALDDA